MSNKYLSILIVERNAEVKDVIAAYLYGVAKQIMWARSMTEAIMIFKNNQPDAAIICLSSCADAIALHEVALYRPYLPIIVINEVKDSELAAEMLQSGVQDFLVKGQFDAYILSQALHFAVHRQKVLERIRTEAYYDELTGVYNRRGFFMVAEHQIKVADRNQDSMALLFIDLDNMKGINDTYGHRIGDQAICRVAELLSDTFRSSDIISRFGGDEFVVLAINADDQSSTILERLAQKIGRDSRTPKISLSVGVAYYEQGGSQGIQELLVEADRNMYEMKRNKVNCVLLAK